MSGPNRFRPTTRRLVLAAVLTVAVAAVPVSVTSPSFASSPADSVEVVVTATSTLEVESCASAFDGVPFTDVAGVHQVSITCLAAWGVAGGFADGTFRPHEVVTRAQFASMLHRLLGSFGVTPATESLRFGDVSTAHTHVEGIGILAAGGIVHGTGGESFGPDAAVTRGQAATMLARTHEQLFGVTLAGLSPDTFHDTRGTTHEQGVLRLAAAGVVGGHADGTFQPGADVSRGQMASFLARYATLLVQQELVAERASEELASGSEPLPEVAGLGAGPQFGVATVSNGWADAELDEVAEIAGQQPSVVLHYLGFGDELHAEQLGAVRRTGATSLLTWEPFDWQVATTDQPQYRLRRIIDGEFDPYLQRTAETLRSFDGPVLLRFAHEMNGDWYPWSERANGNGAGEHIAAWRHIHGLFERAGVDNVAWVWSPNVTFAGSQPLTELYPGDDHVDVIAVDGYNWGTTAAGSAWQSPAQVFAPTMREIRRLAPGKPLMIGETGSAERGGDKAMWMAQLFGWLQTNPDVRALVWFHLDKEADWRIDSSPAAGGAFARGLAHWTSAG